MSINHIQRAIKSAPGKSATMVLVKLAYDQPFHTMTPTKNNHPMIVSKQSAYTTKRDQGFFNHTPAPATKQAADQLKKSG